MSYRYTETIPTPEEKHLAELTAEIVSRRLYIDAPKIAFIRESPIGELVEECRVLGLCDGIKIYLLHGMEARELVRVCAHETRHIKGYYDRKMTREWKEREAFLFEREFLWSLRGWRADELISELIMLRERERRSTRGTTYETR